MQEIIEDNPLELLGINIIASNYLIKKGTNDIIPTLGIDENYNIVIIEYRQNRFGKIINKGLVFIDYIKENISEFKILVSKVLDKEVAAMVNYNPRLIIIGNDFVKYDEYAIKQMNGQIELIKMQGYSNNHILLEKHYQNKTIDVSQWKYRFKNHDEENLYQLINDFVLSLGDEVMGVGYHDYLYYRKIKTFLYVTFGETIECRILGNSGYKTYPLYSEKDFEKIKPKIENSYEQN
jgi:hypothetical protein